MSFSELAQAYRSAANKPDYVCKDLTDLVVDCFLSNRRTFIKIRPHLVKMDFTNLRIISVKIDKEKYPEYNIDFGYYRRNWHGPPRHEPRLWTILMCYPRYLTAFRFLLQYIELFYDNCDDCMQNMIKVMLAPSRGGYEFRHIITKRKAWKLWLKFIKKNDIMYYLDEYQYWRHSSYEPDRNHDLLYFILKKFDHKKEFIVYETFEFFKNALYDPELFKYLLTTYEHNCDGEFKPIEYQYLIEHSLSNGYYQSYLHLYNRGIRIRRIQLDSEDVLHLNKEINLIYTVEHLLPFDFNLIDVQLICNKVAYRLPYRNRKDRIQHLKNIVAILDFNLELTNKKN